MEKLFQFLIALVLLTAWQMLSVIKSHCTVDAAERVNARYNWYR